MPTRYRTGQRIDHYEIIRLLGGGGASSVYLAQDQSALQQVILKFPHDDIIGGTAIFTRYKREGEIGNLLSHPNIQRHLNRGELRSREYLVLEYLRGRTLQVVMNEYAPALLPTQEVLHIISYGSANRYITLNWLLWLAPHISDCMLERRSV